LKTIGRKIAWLPEMIKDETNCGVSVAHQFKYVIA
jgi:hypothetical protein